MNTTIPTLPIIIREAGERLYGPRWKHQMARRAGCHVNTIKAYAAGAFAPSPAFVAWLRDELVANASQCELLSDSI